MSWLNDLRGKVIRYGSQIMPSRQILEFSGEGVEVYDNPGNNVTEVFIAPVGVSAGVTSIFGRTGDVRATVGDYGAADITFDNSGTDMTATECQAAIVELNDLVAHLSETLAGVYPPLESDTLYVLDRYDIGKGIIMTGDTGTVSVPLTDDTEFPIGTFYPVLFNGADLLTIEAQVGVTINVPEGQSAAMASQYAESLLLKTGPDTWSLTGDTRETPSFIQCYLASGDIDPGDAFSPVKESGTDMDVNGSSVTFARTGVYQIIFDGVFDFSGVLRQNYTIHASLNGDIVCQTSNEVILGVLVLSLRASGVFEVTNPATDALSVYNSANSDGELNALSAADTSFTVVRIGDLPA